MQNVFRYRYVVYRPFDAVRALPEQKTGKLIFLSGFLRLIQDESAFQPFMDVVVQNNSLKFWTAFVQEYFEPGAYMRVTLSGNSPANSGTQGTEARSLGLQLLATNTMFTAQSPAAKCLFLAEAPLEVLPRLFHIKYDSGLKEELLFMSDPQETETPSGKYTCYGKQATKC